MDFTARRAQQLWEEGRGRHLAGDVGAALDLYRRSLHLHPSAEAHAFRGWAYSLAGRLEEAIAECRRAIAVDPDLGNPYNDIGSYLVALGRGGEAVLWFERAKRAKRYHPRHFPYMNLARLYASRGEMAQALAELEGALAVCPAEPTCLLLRERFRRLMA